MIVQEHFDVNGHDFVRTYSEDNLDDAEALQIILGGDGNA